MGPVWAANPYVDGSNPSVHLYLIRLKRRGQGIPNPQIWVQIPYEISGYVTKRLCGGLLIRYTQVRPLSCPLKCSDDVMVSILVCQAWRAGSNPVQSLCGDSLIGKLQDKPKEILPGILTAFALCLMLHPKAGNAGSSPAHRSIPAWLKW